MSNSWVPASGSQYDLCGGFPLTPSDLGYFEGFTHHGSGSRCSGRSPFQNFHQCLALHFLPVDLNPTGIERLTLSFTDSSDPTLSQGPWRSWSSRSLSCCNCRVLRSGRRIVRSNCPVIFLFGGVSLSNQLPLPKWWPVLSPWQLGGLGGLGGWRDHEFGRT